MSKNKPKRRRKRKTNFPTASPLETTATQVEKLPESLSMPTADWWKQRFLPGLVLFAAIFVYAYWPTILWFVDAWRREPDYSHGFLVVPLAGLILYQRSHLFPGIRERVSFGGLVLILISIAMRLLGRMAYADFMDGWSIVFLLAGITWFLFGSAAMRWALPAIAFLLLMIPIPYQLENMLSWKLQGAATWLSTATLRTLGQAAVSEGHVVWLGSQRLVVEQACSGLRIFVGVGALAYFWAALAERSWIDRIVIFVAAIPLAILVNSLRITSLGLMYNYAKDPDLQSQLHDYTGLAMIPLAFLMLWGVKVYWEAVYRPIKRHTGRDSLVSS